MSGSSKEYRKKYYEENKEKIKQNVRNWTLKNQDKLKKYYEENKEKIEQYKKEYSSRAETKLLNKERTKRKREEARQFILEYKLSHPCVQCGEKDPLCLVFHHRDSKKYEIPRLQKLGISKTLKSEIEKCDILCANCHQKLHWEKREKPNDQN